MHRKSLTKQLLFSANLIQPLRQRHLCSGKHMGVLIGHVSTLVTYPLRNSDCGKAQIHQKRHVAMANAVDTDTLDAGFFTTSGHFIMQKALAKGEYPIRFLDVPKR